MTGVVPPELVGVWQRESLQINGEAPFEDSRVIWLQTPSRYADLRVGQRTGDALPNAASGSLRWSAPALTFHHNIHFGDRPLEDTGHMSWDGETLIEEGNVTFNGANIDFRERWISRAGSNPKCQSFEARDSADTLLAIALRVDDHAVLMLGQPEFQASYFLRINSRWNLQWCIGDGLEQLLAIFAAAEIGSGTTLCWREVA